jgi:16S rRNA (cytosine1402-N4)-methyltransferase
MHLPVQLQECLGLLAPAVHRPDAVMLDATLGLGGHTEAFLDKFQTLTVVGEEGDRAIGTIRPPVRSTGR